MIENRLLWNIQMDPTRTVLVNTDVSDMHVCRVISNNGRWFNEPVYVPFEKFIIAEKVMIAFKEACKLDVVKQKTHYIGSVDNVAVISALNRGTCKDKEMKYRIISLLSNENGNFYSEA